MKTYLIFVIVLMTSFMTVHGGEKLNILYGPYLQSLSSGEAVISWVTNNESIGWIEIAPDDATSFYNKERLKIYSSSHGQKNKGRIHSVRIKNLKAASKYRYRVFAQEIIYEKGEEVHYGSVSATSIYDKRDLIFETQDSMNISTSFAVINDIHSDTTLLSKLLENALKSDSKSMIYNGDMMSWVLSEKDIFDGFMNTSIKLFATKKPIYFVRGNHETRGDYSSELFKYLGNNGMFYFTFKQGPVFFIVLDSGEDKPDSDIEYYGLADYDAYRDEQIDWLKNIVQSEEFLQSSYKIVINHIPPVSDSNLWHGQNEILEKFVPILNQSNIDLMLCGHLHSYKYTEKNDMLKFPVICNSSTTLLSGVANEEFLKIRILDAGGKCLNEIIIDNNHYEKENTSNW